MRLSKDPRWGEPLGLSRWSRCHHSGSYKREAEVRVRGEGAMRTEGEIRAIHIKVEEGTVSQ